MRMLLASILLLSAVSAYSQEKLPFKIDVVTKKIYPNQAGEQKIEASSVAIGDTIEYTLTYTNVTPKSINDVKIALPIGSSFTYVEGSGSPVPFKVLPNVVSWSVGSIATGRSVSVVARLKLESSPIKSSNLLP
jgi:uncharacterized repeat protein (TIGR01451 family)